MEYEFSPEEIKGIVKAAQVWDQGFNQEQLQQLVDSQYRLADSGFPEAAWAVARLEKERGVHCTEALDSCQELLQEKEGLERSVAAFEIKLEKVKGKVTQAQGELSQIEEATKKAREELQAVQGKRQKEEKDLATFRRKGERGKRAIQKELEQDRQEANVAEEETATAGRLKAEVGKHGLSLDLVLGLAQEFAGCEVIRDKLAEGLKRGLTLTKYNKELVEQNERLESDLSCVHSEIDKGQANYNQLEGAASELRTEIAGNEEIVGLYYRYLPWRPLIEYLGSRYVEFLHCSLCGCLFWMLKLGNTEKTALRCPWCNSSLMIGSDTNAYAASGYPPGTAIRLFSGE